MVVSINPEPNREVFQLLLNNTIDFLKSDSKKKQEEYQKLLGNKLEDAVADVMSEKAKGTPFENSIELIYWGRRVTSKTNSWIDLVEANSQHMRLPLDLKAFLKEKM